MCRVQWWWGTNRINNSIPPTRPLLPSHVHIRGYFYGNATVYINGRNSIISHFSYKSIFYSFYDTLFFFFFTKKNRRPMSFAITPTVRIVSTVQSLLSQGAHQSVRLAGLFTATLDACMPVNKSPGALFAAETFCFSSPYVPHISCCHI